jgi:hypothetical protein
MAELMGVSQGMKFPGLQIGPAFILFKACIGVRSKEWENDRFVP